MAFLFRLETTEGRGDVIERDLAASAPAVVRAAFQVGCRVGKRDPAGKAASVGLVPEDGVGLHVRSVGLRVGTRIGSRAQRSCGNAASR